MLGNLSPGAGVVYVRWDDLTFISEFLKIMIHGLSLIQKFQAWWQSAVTQPEGSGFELNMEFSQGGKVVQWLALSLSSHLHMGLFAWSLCVLPVPKTIMLG